MKLIMILKQTLPSKLQGTHWVPYAPINCVPKINGHFLNEGVRCTDHPELTIVEYVNIASEGWTTTVRGLIIV